MDYILVVDDNSKIRDILSELLRNKGYETREADSGSSCLGQFAAAKPSLILLDIRLNDPEMDGVEILKRIRQKDAGTPVIIMSGHGNIEIAVKAMQIGAFDYLEKPILTGRLLNTVKNAMELVTLRRQVLYQSNPDGRPILLGSSPTFLRYREQLDQAAKSMKASVLLKGAQGTGKETAARLIHTHSHYSNGPFVSVNIPLIAADMIGPALFGIVSEHSSEQGYFDMAEGGCLYLEEISALPLDVQRQLTEVLAQDQFCRVNEKAVPQGGHRFNAKVIASTSKDLSCLTDREIYPPFLERVSNHDIATPSLSDIRDDIPRLADHFIANLHTTHGWPKRELSKDALQFLLSTKWDGNVRQLKNILERVMINNQTQKPISLNELVQSTSERQADFASIISGKYRDLSLKDARQEFEREYIMTQIKRFGGNISQATQIIGLSRSTLHRKLNHLGISNRLATEDDEVAVDSRATSHDPKRPNMV